MSVWGLLRVRWIAWVALVVVVSATACEGVSRARLPKLLKPECVFPSIQTANRSAALRFGFESLLESDRKAQQHGVPLEARKHLRRAFWAITDSCPDDKEVAYDGDNLARHFTALMLRTIHGVDNLVIPASKVLSFWWQGRKEEITAWSKDPQETVDDAAPSADRELEALDKLLPANAARLNRTCLDPGTPDVARKLLRSIGATLISSYFQVWDSTAAPERRLAADSRPAVSSLQRDRMLLLLDALTATSCSTDPQAVLQEQFVALILLARGRAREGNSINPWAEDMQQLRELVPDTLTPAEIDMHSRHPLESAWYHRLDAGVRLRFQRLWTLGDIHMQRPWQGASLLAWTVQLHNLTQQWMVPETFLLGAPKAGTTYLWNCVANSGAFAGEEVCATAAGEQRHDCLRKHKFIYLGQADSGKGRKEFFFFNNRRLKAPPKEMLPEDHKFAMFGLRRDGLSTAITIDATPNYLADEDAYALVYTSARDPAAQRFIVNLRNPVARAFSSWSMFTKWKWRHDTFEECIRSDIKRLYSCWPELKEGPEMVMHMPFSLFSANYKRCIRGTWKDTTSNGLYALQLRTWLEVYNASQFKFITEEGLATKQPIQVLEDVGSFLGMEVPQHVRIGLQELKLGQAPAVVKRVYQLCSSHRAQHQSFDADPKGPAVDALQQFYRPWNEYLWMHMVPASVNRTF